MYIYYTHLICNIVTHAHLKYSLVLLLRRKCAKNPFKRIIIVYDSLQINIINLWTFQAMTTQLTGLMKALHPHGKVIETPNKTYTPIFTKFTKFCSAFTPFILHIGQLQVIRYVCYFFNKLD